MKYVKKPVVIDAIQWTGENVEEISKFLEIEPFNDIPKDNNAYFLDQGGKLQLMIHTLEGDHLASIDDFIIKGIKAEFYPCKPDIFKMTYEKSEDLIQ